MSAIWAWMSQPETVFWVSIASLVISGIALVVNTDRR